jgi:hypothetical protein
MVPRMEISYICILKRILRHLKRYIQRSEDNFCYTVYLCGHHPSEEGEQHLARLHFAPCCQGNLASHFLYRLLSIMISGPHSKSQDNFKPQQPDVS